MPGVKRCSSGKGAARCASGMGWKGCGGGGVPCIFGPLACPDGMGTWYTVSLPAVVNPGSGCLETPIPCSPTQTQAYFIGSCPVWSNFTLCIAGISSFGYLTNTVDENGCAAWQVLRYPFPVPRVYSQFH